MAIDERLTAILPVGVIGREWEYHSRIDSTNNRAGALAARGASHGTLVIADEQTQGRGRQGRRWITPPGCALAFSLVLKGRRLSRSAVSGFTPLGALAVARALADEGAEAWIKWPNDVLLGGKKVAGILAEASWEGDRLEHVILGIGVNVLARSAPDDHLVDFPATSVEAFLGHPPDRFMVLAGILRHIAGLLRDLGSPKLLEAWENRLAYRGQSVVILDGETRREGRVRGLGPSGCLILEVEHGELVEVHGGEMRLRPVDRHGESATLGATEVAHV